MNEKVVTTVSCLPSVSRKPPKSELMPDKRKAQTEWLQAFQGRIFTLLSSCTTSIKNGMSEFFLFTDSISAHCFEKSHACSTSMSATFPYEVRFPPRGSNHCSL